MRNRILLNTTLIFSFLALMISHGCEEVECTPGLNAEFLCADSGDIICEDTSFDPGAGSFGVWVKADAENQLLSTLRVTLNENAIPGIDVITLAGEERIRLRRVISGLPVPQEPGTYIFRFLVSLDDDITENEILQLTIIVEGEDPVGGLPANLLYNPAFYTITNLNDCFEVSSGLPEIDGTDPFTFEIESITPELPVGTDFYIDDNEGEIFVEYFIPENFEYQISVRVTNDEGSVVFDDAFTILYLAPLNLEYDPPFESFTNISGAHTTAPPSVQGGGPLVFELAQTPDFDGNGFPGNVFIDDPEVGAITNVIEFVPGVYRYDIIVNSEDGSSYFPRAYTFELEDDVLGPVSLVYNDQVYDDPVMSFNTGIPEYVGFSNREFELTQFPDESFGSFEIDPVTGEITGGFDEDAPPGVYNFDVIVFDPIGDFDVHYFHNVFTITIVPCPLN